MAEQINVRVKHKGMTLAEWNKSTVILMERELGVATDTGEVRVGNGKDRWSNLPVIKGEKGDQGIQGIQGKQGIQGARGATGQTGAKGDKGDSITVSSTTTDSKGNVVVEFSDGSTVTIPKGDKGERGATGDKGATGETGPKGDKGDPLKFEDLTQEQINQIKAKDVDMSGYATKDDLASVDVSEQLKNYATKEDFNSINNTMKDIPTSLAMMNEELSVKSPLNHTHAITDVNGLQDELDGKALKDHTHDDVYAKGVGVDSEGKIKFVKSGKWYFYNSDSPMGNAVALKDHTHEITDVNGLQKELKTKASSTHYHDIEDINNLQTALNGKASSTHTHDEYLKKGDPIELTPAQKTELKGADGKDGLTTFIRYANNPSGDNMTASPKSDTTHIGIFSSGGRVAPPTPSVYQWTRIKGEDGARGNPGTPGRNGTSITTWVGTQSEYDRIYSKSSSTLYLIKG